MQRPKLRDNKGKGPFELYPLGQIPQEIIYGIGKWVTYHFAVGKSDINGEDCGDIFAKSIQGEHLGKPLGLAALESPDLHFMGNMVLLKRRVVLPYAQLEVNLHASNIHRQAEQAGKQWTPPNLPS